MRGNGVDGRFLFRGESVKFASYRFHTVDYVACPTMCGAFENGMLYEMCQAVEPGLFVAAAGVDCNPEVIDFRLFAKAHNPKPVRECENFCRLMLLHGRV